MKKHIFILLFSGVIGLLIGSCSKNSGSMVGRWAYVPEKSTDLVTWRYRTPEVVVQKEKDRIVILWNWMRRGKVAFRDSLTFCPGSAPSKIPVTSAIWPENWYMGVLAKKNSWKLISGEWKQPGRELFVRKKQVVEISQGEAHITTDYTYTLGSKGRMLTVVEKRSSRPTSITYVFKRID
ncbi:MAG: hypothetical protein GXO76_02615 [Calditrichaeota bacterium]|nr:hypothetical protein [Calditrichota bacterium]